MSRLPALSRVVIGSAAAVSLAVVLPAGAQSGSEPEVEAASDAVAPTKGEQELAKLLEGRVAGEPVSCIRSFRSERFKTIEGTAYVYGRGKTIYVQRTKHPESIDSRDTLVVLRYNPTEICRHDQTTKIDRITGIFTGVVFYDDFVPYTRATGTKPGDG